jgi:hypothetical protein
VEEKANLSQVINRREFVSIRGLFYMQ